MSSSIVCSCSLPVCPLVRQSQGGVLASVLRRFMGKRGWGGWGFSWGKGRFGVVLWGTERLKIYAESGASGASFHPLPCTSRQPPEDGCWGQELAQWWNPGGSRHPPGWSLTAGRRGQMRVIFKSYEPTAWDNCGMTNSCYMIHLPAISWTARLKIRIVWTYYYHK